MQALMTRGGKGGGGNGWGNNGKKGEASRGRRTHHVKARKGTANGRSAHRRKAGSKSPTTACESERVTLKEINPKEARKKGKGGVLETEKREKDTWSAITKNLH